MIYHLLPEVEPFSEQAGGALSRWAANTLRSDSARVICPWADNTWGFDKQRILPSMALNLYGKILRHRGFRVRIAYRVMLLRWILKSIAGRLTAGDVLYIHNRPEYVLALAPMAKRQFKVVLHMHNDHLVNLSEKEKMQMDPDLAIFNSGFLAAQGATLVSGLRRTAVLYNGADEDCFYPANQTNENRLPVVLFVGRLVPEKGVQILVEAMRILHSLGVPVVAHIVGSVNFGDDRSSPFVEGLRSTAPENVQFKPYMAGKLLADEFRRASILCCPSTWDEPFGMVNVEAMASGLPVVATLSGGIPEIFSEGGALLVARNSASELAGALRQLVDAPALRRRLAREGFASYRKRFRWSVIAADYRSLMDGMHELPGSRITPFTEINVRGGSTRSA